MNKVKEIDCCPGRVLRVLCGTRKAVCIGDGKLCDNELFDEGTPENCRYTEGRKKVAGK